MVAARTCSILFFAFKYIYRIVIILIIFNGKTCYFVRMDSPHNILVSFMCSTTTKTINMRMTLLNAKLKEKKTKMRPRGKDKCVRVMYRTRNYVW